MSEEYEVLRELMWYVGDGSRLMRDEDVRYKNGKVDHDSSSSNMEYNEQVRRVVAAARDILSKAKDSNG